MKQTEEEEIMLQIQDTLVSLDLAEQFFFCDLDKCLGECCIEGDAGAPVADDELQKLKDVVPVVWDDLLPQARERITEKGVAYIDEEGDLVTQIVDGATSAPRITHVHRRKLSPLENMQMCLHARPRQRHAALSVHA